MRARILKVKERISFDRELSEKLAKIKIYRDAMGINRDRMPAHNTFKVLRQRLGQQDFVEIHRHFLLQAYKLGLLTPPISDVPKMVRDKIILIGDSTFLKAVASSKGERDHDGNWIFTDDSIAFGKPHHKNKYPVHHRAHMLTSVIGLVLYCCIVNSFTMNLERVICSSAINYMDRVSKAFESEAKKMFYKYS